MTQVQISPEVALREAMIENEWRKNRMLILAQQVHDARAEVAKAKDEIETLQMDARETAERAD